MLPPNPSEKLYNAPTDELIVLLLTQFKRLLEARHVSMTKADMDAIAGCAASSRALPPLADPVRRGVAQLVDESVHVLREQFGLTLAESLATDMSTIEGWQTTADFIDLANHKTNAELRIAAGSSLLVLLGDHGYTDHLFTLLDHDGGANDVDAVFAQRALLHAARVDLPTVDDWYQQVRQWATMQQRR